MAVTQDQIDDLLGTMEALWRQITPLRQRAVELEAGLTSVQRDYDHEVGQANIKADRLRARKASLQAALARKPPPPPTPPPPPPRRPPPVKEIKPGAILPPPPPEDPRDVRKRALADHIYYFLDSDQEEVIQIIHAVLDDDQRDVGDMLELLPWGEIWKAHADWETLEDQYLRLDQWRSALENRVAYWQRVVRQLETDPRQGLLREMKERSREDWLAFLKKLAGQQEEENERLARQVRVLEEQWQAK
jgi:hypothetical protein